MDDLTILEIICLANVGMASYNIRDQVPSNILANNQFIPSSHLKTQSYVKDMDFWTERNKMKLNEKKTTNMVFVKLRSRSSPGPFLVHSRSILSHSNLFQFKIR